MKSNKGETTLYINGSLLKITIGKGLLGTIIKRFLPQMCIFMYESGWVLGYFILFFFFWYVLVLVILQVDFGLNWLFHIKDGIPITLKRVFTFQMTTPHFHFSDSLSKSSIFREGILWISFTNSWLLNYFSSYSRVSFLISIYFTLSLLPDTVYGISKYTIDSLNRGNSLNYRTFSPREW